MINLLAISYKNIGPFKDKSITIFFKTGKYLIKAPIGTGKSFLFFDGPMYGLYKYSSRSVLNNKSKEGTIKLLFEYNGETRLITRTITKAKTKESCTSKLFKITSDQELFFPAEELISYTTDIEDELKSMGIQREETIFKNETDLQQTLISFLPPREVFINTVFLMQDSDNIFELIPSERLLILKNVFGLLGIDEAKEEIAEKRKEVTYKLKAYTDTSIYDQKIKTYIQKYVAAVYALQEQKEKIGDTSPFPKEMDELDAIKEKITISELEGDIFSTDVTGQIDTIILDKKNIYQKNKNQLEHIQQQKKDLQKNIDSKRQEGIILQKANEELDKNINKNNPEIVKNLKKEKQTLQTQQEKIQQLVPLQTIEKFLEAKEHHYFFEEFKKEKNINISSAYLLIQYLSNKGKSFQEEIKTKQAMIKNEELQQEHQQEKIKTQIHTEQEKLKTQNEQRSKLEATIKQFEEHIESKATFNCEKIQANCPFIKLINKKTFDQFQTQKEEFIKQKELCEKEIKTIENSIKAKQEELETVQKTKEKGTNETLLNQIKTDETAILQIREFLTEIDWKQQQANYTQYIDTQEKMSQVDKELFNQEIWEQQRETYKQQKEKNEGMLANINQQIQTYLKEQEILETTYQQTEKEIKTIDYNLLSQAEQTSIVCKQIQHDIQNLIEDYKNIKTQIYQLQHKEKQLNNLYGIFSKELLLLVLQDHLPVLNDIVNNYLAQIVDYQINLSLNKSNSEKLELEANIIDQQGEREIKSLSGGQKIILKIVWMLAISSYMNSPILFLDETINNLDTETISKVADILEDFVKQKNMKLYTVTHNQQIQDMNIRDKTIEI